MDLTAKKCVPCDSGVAPLSQEEAEPLAAQVPDWELGVASIERSFKFKDFREAMVFINQVADMAEAESHHPDIYMHYNKVRLVLKTNKVGGLTENDFILAAKIDQLL